jgi:hypothetical protein
MRSLILCSRLARRERHDTLLAFNSLLAREHESALGARDCRAARVPIRRILECGGCVQHNLISEPTADQLHADGQALRANAAGKRAPWQAEHARKAQKIRMIVVGVARVVAVAFDAVRYERRDSRRGRRGDDVHLVVRCP